jgi:uncharacterized protein YegP (UPF0339 family)
MDQTSGRWEVFKDEDGQWRFRFKAGNNQVMLASEGYHNRHDAYHAVEILKDNVASAEIRELDH